MTSIYRGFEIQVETLDDQFGDEKIARIRNMNTGLIVSTAYHPIGRARDIIEAQARGWIDGFVDSRK